MKLNYGFDSSLSGFALQAELQTKSVSLEERIVQNQAALDLECKKHKKRLTEGVGTVFISRNNFRYYSKDSFCQARTSGENQINDTQFNGSVALWRAVILQAVIDASTTAKRTERQIAKKSALKWFNKDNKDFLFVCSQAMLPVDYVLKKVEFAIANHTSWKRNLDRL